ncbi:hypothetical protein BTM25_42480 [Actinomadura rubteroloni]|uniref:DUF4333 domain-containing protein n=1 Tax=Actinomadura rubteroloni TaxID=1926885 RepID=A0A2P4UKL6_9ACTN|nr:hypothetical protein [Actinomadura rubteroloni]POM25600.1 hypothetical protein BTM25_42480 [Actinomadura rubteroloni]
MKRIVALGVLVALSTSGCRVMQHISDGAYRNAVADGTVDDLRSRGIALRARPECEFPVRTGEDMLTIRCTARAADGAPVTVTGRASRVDRSDPLEEYVVTVGNRVVLRQDCLGLGCVHRNH